MDQTMNAASAADRWPPPRVGRMVLWRDYPQGELLPALVMRVWPTPPWASPGNDLEQVDLLVFSGIGPGDTRTTVPHGRHVPGLRGCWIYVEEDDS